MSLDDVEKLNLEKILPELRKAVASGAGGQTLASALATMEQRMELFSREEFTPEGSEARRNKAAIENAAAHVEFSRLSEKAQHQFDRFIDSGFRSKQDLDSLSVFLTENSEILTDIQRTQIVDEVLEGVERRDYTIDEIPDNVMKEVREVLQQPTVNQAITAKLSNEDARRLNEALMSDDSADLRNALKDPEIFTATQESVDSAREEMERQHMKERSAPALQGKHPIEEVQPDRDDASLLAEFTQEFDAVAKSPSDLPQHGNQDVKIR